MSRFPFSSRLTAALKAFSNPHLLAKSLGYGGYGYQTPDLSTGSALTWTKWGAASAVLLNTAIYACIETRAEAVSKLPFRVVDRETRKETDPEREPFMRLLSAYSREYGGQSIFREWMYDRDITGEVYVEPIRDEWTGRVIGLDTLNSLHVTPFSMDGRTIDYYQYTDGMANIRIAPDALVYDRNTIARMTNINGYSPVLLVVASGDVGIMQAAGKALLAYFNNDGLPGSVIMPDEVKQTFQQGDVDWLTRQLKPNKNAAGKYSTLILPHRGDFQMFDQPDLLKWSELLSSKEPAVYTAFRTPRSVAGDSDTTRYQTSPEDRRNFDRIIAGIADDIAGVINTSILPLLYNDPQPGVEFEFETAELDHIDEDERQAARDAYQDGVITLNEYRAVMGYEEIDGGDVYIKRAGTEYVTAEAFQPVDPSPALPQPETPVQIPAQTPDRQPALSEADELEMFDKFVRSGTAAKRAFEFRAIDPDTAACITSDAFAAPDASTYKSVIAEWRVALAARSGNIPAALPDATKSYRDSLSALSLTPAQIREATEAHAAGVLSRKALSRVRSRFESECLRLMTRAVDERIGKARFQRDMEIMLYRYARQALIEGYADGGIPEYEPESDDDRWLSAFNDQQSQYVANVASALYADDVLTSDEIAGKPQLWWNKSVHPAYAEGLTRASGDGVAVFYNGPTEEKCGDCSRLHLQARRLSTWRKYLGDALVPSAATQCGGWRCECVITPRQTAISRGALPRLIGGRKAVTNGVEMEVIHVG